MASLERKGKNYYVRYRDQHGKQRKRSTGVSNLEDAKVVLAQYERDEALIGCGALERDEVRLRTARSLPIEDYIPAFQKKILDRAGTDTMTKNCREQLHYVRLFAKHARITLIGEISHDNACSYRDHLMAQGKSARTVQAHVRALKHFTGWLYRNGNLPRDPLLSVDLKSPSKDRRYRRRAMSKEEWGWFIKGTLDLGRGCAASRGKKMSGEERALLYRVAVATGLRADELRSLRVADFRLDIGRVCLDSNNSKNGQEAYQHLNANLIDELESHLNDKQWSDSAFNMPCESKLPAMVRADLERARKLWIEEANTDDEVARRSASDFLAVRNRHGQVFDFHCLRYTCGAWLVQSGVNAKVVQSVMRHSTIKLTFDTYGYLFEGQEAEAVKVFDGIS